MSWAAPRSSDPPELDVLPWPVQWGQAIAVLAPKNLRRHVARQLRAAAATYDDPDDDTERVTQRRDPPLALRQHGRGDAMPKVLSLNVTDGGRRVQPLVADALASLAHDLVTLQEIRADTVASWRSALEREGYHVADTFDLARQHDLPHPSRFRTDGLLIASRWPLQALDPTRWELPWPERLLSVRVDHPRGPIELHTAHVPNASTGISLYRKGQHALGRERLMKKLETLEGVHRAVTAPSDAARILTGDVNTPHSEHPDGSVRYWQHSCPAPLRPELERRWQAAERSVIEGLREHGFTDAYRATHGPNGDGFSWEHGASGNRYRYDHVFASRELRPVACD